MAIFTQSSIDKGGIFESSTRSEKSLKTGNKKTAYGHVQIRSIIARRPQLIGHLSAEFIEFLTSLWPSISPDSPQGPTFVHVHSMGPRCQVGRIINRTGRTLYVWPLYFHGNKNRKDYHILADCHHTILLLDSYHQDDDETTDCFCNSNSRCSRISRAPERTWKFTI